MQSLYREKMYVLRYGHKNAYVSSCDPYNNCSVGVKGADIYTEYELGIRGWVDSHPYDYRKFRDSAEMSYTIVPVNVYIEIIEQQQEKT